MENPRPRRPSALSGSHWPKLLLGLGALGVVLVAGGVLWLPSHEHDVLALIDPVRAREQRELAELFRQAKRHLLAEQWLDAKATLLQLKARAPEFPGVEDYLAHVEKEFSNEAHLRASQAARVDQKLAAAKAELDQVRPDTLMAEQVAAQRRALREAAEKRVAEAKVLLDTGEPFKAKDSLADVLATFPDHREAQELSKTSIRLCEYPASPSPPERSDPWRQVLGAFKRNDLAGATALANACAAQSARCKSGVSNLKEFSWLAQRLETLTAGQLRRLVALDKQLTGDPDSSEVIVQIQSNLKARAQDHYLQAYALKKTAPAQARKEFQRVLDWTQPEDEVHQKAKAWIQRLPKK